VEAAFFSAFKPINTAIFSAFRQVSPATSEADCLPALTLTVTLHTHSPVATFGIAQFGWDRKPGL